MKQISGSFVILITVVMLATVFSGASIQANTSTIVSITQPLHTQNPAANGAGAVELDYIITSGEKVTHVTSYVKIWSNGTVFDRTIEQNGSSQLPWNTVDILQPLSFFGVSVPNGHTYATDSQSIEGVAGKVIISSMIKGNSVGLVSSAIGYATDSEIGFHLHVEVQLLSNASALERVLSNLRTNGTYFVFIPELINPSNYDKLLGDNSTVSVSNGTNGVDPELFLQEKDNTNPYPFGHINVWHLGVTLSVSSFSPGGNSYSASIDAGADSINWGEVSSSLTSTSTHNSNYAEVDSTGSAVFLGFFLGGYYEGRPTVTVSESFSFISYGLTVSGTIHDPLYIWLQFFWDKYSDYSNAYYNFNQQDVTRFMVS